MEHPCHQCGATVEEGIRFCSGCGAPQIRVTGLDPVTEPEPEAPVAVPVFTANRIDWSQGFPAAIMAGLSMGAFSLLPILGIGVCLWMLVGGGFCVLLYHRRTRGALVTASMGGRLGAVAGLFGFVLYAIGASLQLLLLRSNELRDALRQAVEQSAKSNPDPRAQEILQWFATPEGLAVFITLTMVMFLFAFVIFGSIGGALWASLSPRARR